MKRLMSVCLTLLMVLTNVAGPVFAYDEPVDLTAETGTEAVQEEAFVEGYVSIEKGTTAYADLEGKEEAGTFASDSIVYAESSTDEDWCQVFFDTESRIEEEENYLSVYVKAEDCEPLTAEELAAQVEVFEKAVNQYENVALTVADFEEISKEETADEEKAETESDSESELKTEDTKGTDKGAQTKSSSVITSNPASVTASEGQNAVFRITASGSGLKYQWQSRISGANAWGNTSMTGYNTQTLTVKASKNLNGAQFRCVATDSNGATYTSTVATLNVVDGPAFTSQPASVTKSAGSTATFKVAATGSGLTYQWQSKASGATAWGNTGMTGNKTNTLTVNATLGLSGVQFRCVATDQYGNSLPSNAATLTVVEGPKITSNPASVTKNAGQSATFKVAATGSGITYQWQSKASGGSWGNTGMTGNKTATLTVNATMGLTGAQFRCVVKDQYGNSVTSNAATLTVLSNISITSQPASVTTSAGSKATFKVAASGTGLTYQWQSKASGGSWGNTGMTGNKTNTLTVNATLGLSGVQFRCVVKDQYGSTATSNAATLTVVDGPKITSNPASVTKTIGETATFKVAASGSGLTYQWQSKAPSATAWGNTSMTGNKTATLTVNSTMGLNGVQFRCVVTDKYGASVTSGAATLKVLSKISITSHPASVTTSAGATATFKVTASGSGLTYQWQSRASGGSWGNTGMTGNKTATLTVNATKGLSGVQFRCMVTDQYGTSVASNAATLTVVEGPHITSNPASGTTSAGTTKTFKVVATGTGLTYQWQSRSSGGSWGNTGMTGNKTAALTVNATMGLNGVQFRCVVKDKYGATATSNAATLTVVEGPRISSNPASGTTSAGSTKTFKVVATGTGLTYQWQSKASGGSWGNTGMTGNKTATLTVSATMGLNGTQFRCVVKDKYGATVTSNAATLTVVEGPRISSNPASVTTSAGMTATFRVAASGSGLTYQWQSRSSGGSWGNTSMTGSKTATLSVTATMGLSGVQFRCVVKDKYGATATSNAATLTVVERPMISSNPVSVTKTEGQTATFKVAASGTGISYQWQSKAPGGSWGNTGMSGNKTATLTVNATLGLNGVQFRCVVTDKYGNSAISNAATLTVVAAPKIISNPVSVRKVEGQTATFTVSATGTGLTYQWQSKAPGGSWGNTGMTGNKTDTLTVKATMGLDGVQFRCVVKDQYGATATSGAATLTVVKALVITTHPSSVTKNEGETATFKVVASGSGLTYQWQSKASGGSWGNTSMTGSTTATLTVTASMSLNGAQFRCVVSDQYGSSLTSNAATLTVIPAPKYRALLVGNVNYDETPLYGSEKDVYALKGMLTGLKNKYTVTTKVDLTSSQILNAIPSAFAGATENDVSLFFYAGHGLQTGTYNDEYQGALCGIGEGRDYVSIKQLANALSQVPGKVIVILSSCHSGAAIAKGISKEDSAAEFNEHVIDTFASLEKKSDVANYGELANSKYIVLTAAKATTEGWASDSYHVLTYCIMSGVGCSYPNGAYSGSMPADVNSNSLVTLGEIYDYSAEMAYEMTETLDPPQYVQYYGSRDYVMFRRK